MVPDNEERSAFLCPSRRLRRSWVDSTLAQLARQAPPRDSDQVFMNQLTFLHRLFSEPPSDRYRDTQGATGSHINCLHLPSSTHVQQEAWDLTHDSSRSNHHSNGLAMVDRELPLALSASSTISSAQRNRGTSCS